MKINIIAAMDNNGVIGVNGKIPWHITEDMKRFKALTTGHAVIMGRKTFHSIGKPLLNRLNIILTKAWFYRKCSDIRIYSASLSNALARAKKREFAEAFIIGGSRLYEEALPLADTVYLTKVNQSVPFVEEVGKGDEVARFPVEAWRKEKENFELDKVEYFDGFWFETWQRK